MVTSWWIIRYCHSVSDDAAAIFGYDFRAYIENTVLKVSFLRFGEDVYEIAESAA